MIFKMTKTHETAVIYFPKSNQEIERIEHNSLYVFEGVHFLCRRNVLKVIIAIVALYIFACKSSFSNICENTYNAL